MHRETLKTGKDDEEGVDKDLTVDFNGNNVYNKASGKRTMEIK